MKLNNRNPLIRMISYKTIALNVEVKTWEEAVRIAGNLLVNTGSVESRYVDAMIESVKHLGPYVVIAPGVALPHARPEDGVFEPCMSLVTLKNPVIFGNKNNDPVKIIFSFGSVDKKRHIEALTKLARIIGDKEKLDALKNANTIEVVEEIIRRPI
jgi:mannitol operon transcriptional antiterminator